MHFDDSGTATDPQKIALANAIIDSADDAIVSKNLDGVIQSWNRGAERIFGYTAAEAVGRSITMLIPPELQHEEPQILARLRVGERIDQYETVRVAKDGRRVPVSLTVSPIKDTNGTVVGASKITRDISERKRAEAFRRAKAAELQAVIEAVPAAVIIAEDSECRSVRANRAGYELLLAMTDPPTPPASSQKRGERDSIEHSIPLIKDVANLRRAAGGETVCDWHERVTLADGTERHFLGYAVPLLDEADRPQGAIAALLDITPRVLAEQALRDADRRKDEFLAMLAHELRNPLAPIRAGLEIIQNNLSSPGRREWALQVVDRQLVQLTRIVEDLLDLARIVSGDVVLKRHPTSLRAVVSNAVETTRPLINAQRLVLRVDLPLADVRLNVDPVRLAQALSNLLSNASKFTEPGGTIAVTAAASQGSATITVLDNGCGIEPDLQPRIFDMFVQTKQDLARSAGGLGVGLAVVRRIVELHGGSVEVHSRGKGLGSTFRIRLPTVDPVGPSEAIAGEPQGRPSSPRRVLIVDDNRDAADSLAECLRLQGHEVTSHYEGTGVLQRAMAFRADVVVLDLGLPGRDGFEVARELRAHPELKHLPLIAVSGYGQATDIEQSRAAGLDFHLIKPVDSALLLNLIEGKGELPNP